ncbi:unnamed protein product [Schistocephalus solidus]|uniref:Transposase n=1 Tax=Schistocephalus solidus TaxID=70667 RepID=A0A183T868_SCHSO|nr:unnamed protein product [Schistocephalus solidus]
MFRVARCESDTIETRSHTETRKILRDYGKPEKLGLAGESTDGVVDQQVVALFGVIGSGSFQPGLTGLWQSSHPKAQLSLRRHD